MFRLALALGRTVRELQASMDSDELTEWAAYHKLDPFGGVRGDYQSAIITSNLMNALAGKVVTKTSDFIPEFGPARLTPRMSPAEIYHALAARKFGRPERE